MTPTEREVCPRCGRPKAKSRAGWARAQSRNNASRVCGREFGERDGDEPLQECLDLNVDRLEVENGRLTTELARYHSEVIRLKEQGDCVRCGLCAFGRTDEELCRGCAEAVELRAAIAARDAEIGRYQRELASLRDQAEKQIAGCLRMMANDDATPTVARVYDSRRVETVVFLHWVNAAISAAAPPPEAPDSLALAPETKG